MSRILKAPLSILLLLSCAFNASAHGSKEHVQVEVPPDADWATRHMAEEHHIAGFDAEFFFRLHDYDNTGVWASQDIRRTYGLEDPSSASISDAKKQLVVQTILDMFDINKDGVITLEEFAKKDAEGTKLPDFGLGPGHHGDDEYEYEIHHWEKYHSGDDVKEEDLNHPEDIAHFKMHEEKEARQEEWERLELRGVVEKNIPEKFRRHR